MKTLAESIFSKDLVSSEPPLDLKHIYVEIKNMAHNRKFEEVLYKKINSGYVPDHQIFILDGTEREIFKQDYITVGFAFPNNLIYKETHGKETIALGVSISIGPGDEFYDEDPSQLYLSRADLLWMEIDTHGCHAININLYDTSFNAEKSADLKTIAKITNKNLKDIIKYL